MELIDKNGQEVKPGDKVTSFRGESAVVESIELPRHAGSTGRVHTTIGSHFPSVYDLAWIERDDQ